ncbi:diguanylate cyclase domain-containing protein [Zavarzinia sp.]|uniref:diguanylate cyclase domain-containing protein n=1 Tax=Zavarzinia sp. TaxID=2027920 RepID=UPI003BB5C9DE
MPARADPRLRAAVFAAGLGVACFVLALGAIHLSRQPGSIATLWYANALTVSAIVFRPSRRWLAPLIGFSGANVAANLLFGDPWSLSILFTAANLAEIVFSGWSLQRWCKPEQAIEHPGALLKVLLLGSSLPAAVGATIGSGILAAYGLAPYGTVWFAWFVGSAIGSAAILPIALAVGIRGARHVLAVLGRPMVLVSLLGLVAVALFVPTNLPYPYVYMSVALVVVAYVGGFEAAALGGLIVCLTVGALISLGIFTQPPTVSRFGEVMFYLPLVFTLIPPMALASSLEMIRDSLARLADKTERFRSLYEHTPAIMHSIDAEGFIVSVSAAWLRRLGYEKSEVIGRRSTDFLTPESRRFAFEEVMPRFWRDGHVEDVPYRMVAKDGRLIDVLLSAVWETDAQGNRLRTLAVMEDVTEKRLLAAELAAEQELMDAAMHSIGDAVLVVDERGIVTYLNPAAERLLEQGGEGVRGRLLNEAVRLFSADDGLAVDPLEAGNMRPAKVALLSAAGRPERAVSLQASPIRARDGDRLGSVLVLHDVTEARRMAQHMAQLAHYDSVTGLPNRILFQDRILQACRSARQHGSSFAVIFLDVDRFKSINDTQGHDVGDLVLNQVARRLSDGLRDSDTVCRLGGDEFVMLAALDGGGNGGAELIARRIVESFATPIEVGDKSLDVTVSIGMAIYPRDGTDPDSLLKSADTAMYMVKRAGRNGYRRASDDGRPRLPPD